MPMSLMQVPQLPMQMSSLYAQEPQVMLQLDSDRTHVPVFPSEAHWNEDPHSGPDPLSGGNPFLTST